MVQPSFLHLLESGARRRFDWLGMLPEIHFHAGVLVKSDLAVPRSLASSRFDMSFRY